MNPRLFRHIRHIRSCSAAETRDDNLDILLAGGAVGEALAFLFLMIVLFYSGIAYQERNFPVSMNYAVEVKLLAIRDEPEAAPLVPNVGEKAPPDEGAEIGPYWYEFWNEGMSVAVREHKPVLVMFTGYNCHWCREMEKKTLPAPDIRERLAADWVCIRINIDVPKKTGEFDGKTMSYRGLAQFFRVDGVPSSLFIDRERKPIQVVAGYWESRVYGILLDYMKNEVYAKNIPFEKYRMTLSSAGH